MPLEVKHQSGNKKSVGVKESYSSKISIEVKEFYDSPHDQFYGLILLFLELEHCHCQRLQVLEGDR